MSKFSPEAPTEAFLRSIDIHELLPQREPFVMIGALTAFTMKKIVTETVVRPEGPLHDGDALSAAGLVENVAQTCAARIGYINKYILHRGIDVGYIGAVRSFSVRALPKAGTRLVTSVEVLEEVFSMTLVSATVTAEGEVIAAGEMKIAVKAEA